MFVTHGIHILFDAIFRRDAHLNHLKFDDPQNVIPYLPGRLNKIEITVINNNEQKQKRKPSKTPHSEIYYRGFKKHH